MAIILSICAAIFFALSHISVRQGVSRLGVANGTAIMLIVGTVTTTVAALILEKPSILYTATFVGVLYFALAGVVHFIGGWGFMNASARRIGPTRVSSMTSLTPLFAAILALFSLNQHLNLYITGGILMIVFGIYMVSTSKE